MFKVIDELKTAIHMLLLCHNTRFLMLSWLLFRIHRLHRFIFVCCAFKIIKAFVCWSGGRFKSIFSQRKKMCGMKWYSNVTVLASQHHTNQNNMNEWIEWTKTQNIATISDRVTDFFSLLYFFLSSLFTSFPCRIVNQWTVCIKVASSAHAHLHYVCVCFFCVLNRHKK